MTLKLDITYTHYSSLNTSTLNRDETVMKVYKYFGDEEYINTTIRLFEPPKHTLTPGIYSFPFSFTIPDNIPCSFSGTFGKVRYFIRYRTNHCLGNSYITFSKDKETVGIVILSLHDLNKLPDIWQPVQFNGSKTFGALSLVTNALPLFVEVFLPKKGYVPGEIIPISAKISNETDTAIKRCEIWIHQNVVYTAERGGKTEETDENFSKIKRPGFGARTQEVWNCVPYYVPALPPTSLPHCKYINIHHWLKIRFVPNSSISYDLNLRVKIIIGNVPVRPGGQDGGVPDNIVNQQLPDSTVYSSTPGAPSVPVAPSAPLAPSAPPDELIDDMTTPPSYEIASSNANNHISSVKFCEVPKGETDWGGLFSRVMSNYGTESCRPKHPVFDLNVQDFAEREFEFL